MGKGGCKYIDKNKSFVVKAEEHEVIDKTGAGDVVTGVFISMMAKTNNPEASLREAVSIATDSIQDYGVDFLVNKEILPMHRTKQILLSFYVVHYYWYNWNNSRNLFINNWDSYLF